MPGPSGIQKRRRERSPQPGPSGVQKRRREISPQPGPSGVGRTIDCRGVDIGSLVNITLVRRTVKRSMDHSKYRIDLSDELFTGSALFTSMERVFRHVGLYILNLRPNMESEYRIRIGFNFNLNDDAHAPYYVNIPFERLTNLDTLLSYIFSRIESAFQSNESVILKSFKMDVKMYRTPSGHALLLPKGIDFHRCKVFKKHIDREDNVGCAFKAVLIAKYFVVERKNAREVWIGPQFIQKARQLAQECGLDYDTPLRIDQFTYIENTLRCRILVYGPGGNDRVFHPLYIPRFSDRTAPLLIIGNEGMHYYPIRSIADSFPKSRDFYTQAHGFCRTCYTFFHNLPKHLESCEYVCRQCMHYNCRGVIPNTAGVALIDCVNCKRKFYDEQCLRNHRVNSTCRRVKQCERCGDVTMVRTGRIEHTHDCTKIKCMKCYHTYPADGSEDHTCWMAKSKQKMSKTWRVVYYDIETYTPSNSSDLHPYILISQTICNNCHSSDNVCNSCGARTRVYQDGNIIEAFIKDLIAEKDKNGTKTKTFVVAHNGSKFDTQFLYKEALLSFDPDILSDDPIKRGRKIFQLQLSERIIIKDSLLFLPSSLKKLPKTMGIQELEKGYFPYTFLNETTLDYIGDIPDRSEFAFTRMDEDEKRVFNEEFYSRYENGERYSIREECIKYCKQDVDILRQCMEKFRQDIISRFEIDPLESCATIASLCYKIYKDHFMPHRSITMIDRNIQKTFSFKGIRWILYQSETTNTRILHARNGGEVGVKLWNRVHYPDGYVRNENGGRNKVYEFLDCFYHGCQKQECRLRKDRMLGDDSALDRYVKTMKKLDEYRKTHEVESIWECEYEEMLDNNPGLRHHVNELSDNVVNSTLECGKALYGGRCNPITLSYESREEGTHIQYFDFTSLYPSVMVKNKFPVGKPRKLVSVNELPTCTDLERHVNTRFFGLCYIDILPPQDLYLPVLPATIEGKLMFPLCVACAKTNSRECNHDERERMLRGVYTSPEIALAVQYGYRIRKVREIWQFESHVNLFSGYVKHFLKEKIEASGFPRGVITEDEKHAYVQRVNDRENINLDVSNVEKNPGKRFRSKLALNSLWGKFAQRVRDGNVKLCRTDDELMELFQRGDIEVMDLDVVGQYYVVRYNHKEYSEVESSVTCVPLASFVTAYARIQLYKLMSSLGERVLYCDTDSVVFVSRRGDSVPNTGEFLGDLTDEIKDAYGDDAYADAFVSPGPKSYALRIHVGDECKYIIRAKGLSLNPTTKGIITFDNMKKMLSDDDDPDHFDIPFMQLRAQKHGGVSEVRGSKVFRKTYRKRVELDNQFRTVPFGYIGNINHI